MAVGDSFPCRKRIGNECILGRLGPFNQAGLVLPSHNHDNSPQIDAMITGCFHGEHLEGRVGFVYYSSQRRHCVPFTAILYLGRLV